jgi:hypothetical protein
MMTKGIFVVAGFVFALAILNAKVAQSDNDRSSHPTIRTLPRGLGGGGAIWRRHD